MSSTKIHTSVNPIKENQLRSIKQRVASSRVGSTKSFTGPPVDLVSDHDDRYRERGQRPVDGSRQYENGSSEHYRSPSYDQRISQLQPHPPQYARNEESPPVRRNTDSTGNILHGPYAHHASQSTQSSHQSNYNNNLPSSSPSEFSLPDVRRKSNGQVVPPDILTTNPPRQLRPKAASTGRELPTPRQLTFQEVHTSRLEIGLENLGNTCFMNSMLQCLLHIEPLVSYFLLGKMEADLNPSSPKRGMIAASFHHLIQDVFNGKSGSAIAPVNFQRVVSMYAPYLMDFQQQDSQEFLRFLLDGMSEDLCRRKPCGNSQNHVQSASTDCPQNRAVAVRTPTKSGSPILPSLPHITSTTSPGTGGDGHPQTSSRVGSDGKASSIQRLRLETRSMRALDHTSPRQEPSSTGTGRASNQEEDVEPSGKDSHPPQPVLPSATFPGGAHHNKLRVLHDIQQSRLTNEEDIDHDGADVGIAANVEEEVAQSPREGAGGSSSSGRQTLSSQLRDVMTLRLRRTKPATEGSELSRTAPLVSADDSSVGGSGKDQHGSLSSRTVVVADSAVEAEAAVAWERYLKLNDSVITDIFGGLLQSTIECLTCHHRSHSFDPFLDISVPISRDSDSNGSGRGLFGTLRQATMSDGNRSTLEKCLAKFTAEEVLDGDNSYLCEKCKKKRKSVKQLMIYRYPKVLVIHIKRFRFNSTTREKLSTDVHFPLTGLDLSPFVRRIAGMSPSSAADHDNQAAAPAGATGGPSSGSSSAAAAAAPNAAVLWQQCHNLRHLAPVYDLVGVSNHHGSLNGGHYIAHVDTNNGHNRNQQRWMCFNDARVSNANASSIAGPTAYVLFYRLREDDLSRPSAEAQQPLPGTS